MTTQTNIQTDRRHKKCIFRYADGNESILRVMFGQKHAVADVGDNEMLLVMLVATVMAS